ncbi:MAG: hypothetical protein L0H78_26025, partial [Humibacillus sp.]|nr:hypothetical protein [Humibacillus sp.]
MSWPSDSAAFGPVAVRVGLLSVVALGSVEVAPGRGVELALEAGVVAVGGRDVSAVGGLVEADEQPVTTVTRRVVTATAAGG